MKKTLRRIGCLLAAISVSALSLLALSGCDKEDSGWYPAGMKLAGGGGVYNASEYWDKYKSDLESTLTDIKYDETTEDGLSLLLDETEALKYSYTATVTGTEYHFMHVICVRNGNVYMLTYTAIPAYYDAHMEDVQSIIDNFSWVDD